MDKNVVMIKESIKGISGGLIKRILYLIVLGILYALVNSFRLSLYTKNKIVSILSGSFIDKPLEYGEIILTIIVLAIILIIVLINLFKFFSLFYEVFRVVEINYFDEKIIISSYFFPFFKDVQENKFDRIVSIGVKQDLFGRLLNTGSLTVDYLVSSKIDSYSEEFEIPNISEPFNLSSNLLN